MRFNPTYIISGFIMRRIISIFVKDKTFATLFSLLFSTTASLVLTVGVIPTIRVLYALGKVISKFKFKKFSFISFSSIINSLPRLNPIVKERLLEVIKPFFDVILKNPITFSKLYKMYFVLVVFSSFKLLSFSIIKFLLTTLLSSLGILWSDFLSSIVWLKFIAESVVDFTNYIFKTFGKLIGIDNVKVGVEGVKEVDSVKEEIDGVKNVDTDLIPTIALVILGLTGIIILTMIGDYYAHDTIRSVPCLGSILDSIYSFINPMIDWITGKKPPIIDPKDINPKLPDRILLPHPKPISRSSSGSSSGSSTASQGSIPTPPATRTPTPSLSEEYSDVLNGNWS